MPDPSEIIVHVGLHKCASTWLQKKIFARADLGIQCPWGPMAHAAPSEFVSVDPLAFDHKATRGRFDEKVSGDGVAIVSHEALSSRPHHGHYYAPQVAERLKATFPEAKLLLMFREQSKILYSLYGEHVRNGGRHTLQEFLGSGQEQAGWVPFAHLSFFEYDKLLKMYQDIFGADKVLARPMEMLKHQPDALAKDIFGFLGMPAPELEHSTQANKGWGAATVEFYRRTSGLVRKNPIGPENGPLFRARQFVAWRLDRVLPKSLNTKMEQKRRDQISERIAGRYVQSNQRLAEMLDLDLKGLGYQ